MKKTPYRDVVWRERCEKLDWQKIHDHLINEGWVARNLTSFNSIIFRKEVNERSVELHLPTGGVSDYWFGMFRVVERLAEAEDVYDEEIMQRFEKL